MRPFRVDLRIAVQPTRVHNIILRSPVVITIRRAPLDNPFTERPSDRPRASERSLVGRRRWRHWKRTERFLNDFPVSLLLSGFRDPRKLDARLSHRFCFPPTRWMREPNETRVRIITQVRVYWVVAVIIAFYNGDNRTWTDTMCARASKRLSPLVARWRWRCSWRQQRWQSAATGRH